MFFLAGSGLLTVSPPVYSDEIKPAAILDSFDISDLNTSFSRLHYLISFGPDQKAVSAIKVRLGSTNPQVRFAAIYLLIHIAGEAETALLLEAVKDPVPAFRTIAAGALIGLGERSAFPLLIDALRSDEGLPYSDPPKPLRAFSQQTLEAYVAEESRPAGADGWDDWWVTHQERLMWSDSLKRYVLH
ncbi:MAG: hypothetical protein CL569_04655 [Alphaproteobacteria bacterium]|nr:hypothetical protein [Alphaproteobacteria bacterium]